MLLLLTVGTVQLQAQQASKKADALLPEAERRYEYFFLEAANRQALEEYAEAFELYRHALTINPRGAAALYEAARLYLYLNQPEQALKHMKQAVALDADNYWYAEALASLYQQRGMTDEAIALLEDMTVRFANHSEPLFGLLDLYNRRQMYAPMIETLTRLEQRTGKNEQLAMEKFRIYVRQGNMEAAFDEIEALTTEYPLDMRYLTVLGDVYLQNDKPQEAYEAYKKVLQTEPGNAMAQLSMASYYEKTGNTAAHQAQLDTLLLNPTVDPEVKLNIMRQLILKAEQEKADSTAIIARFDNLLATDTEDTQIPMLYAQYLISKQLEEKSIPVLEHILRLDPSNTAARFTLLGNAIRSNDFDRVIRITEPGVEVTPEVLEFAYYLGISYYQKDRYEDALTTLQNALKHGKDAKADLLSEFHSMIGDILHSMRRTDEAFAAYDTAITYNARNIGALNNYAYYISIMPKPTPAQLDKAEEMSHTTVKSEPTNSTYLDTYAWILFVKKNYGQARIYIDQAITNGGKESDVILEHAGDIYFKNDLKDEALKYWRAALEAGSESRTLKKKISRKKYIEP